MADRANEPAYPDSERSYEDRSGYTIHESRGGLTIREHFAGLAITWTPAEFDIAREREKDIARKGYQRSDEEIIAMFQLRRADALIAALEAK